MDQMILEHGKILIVVVLEVIPFLENRKGCLLLKLPLPIAGILRVGDYQSNGARKQVGCELDLCSSLSTSQAQPAEQSSRLEQVTGSFRKD
ncbi:hypothetical protein CDAR_188911 [Caerostris darwini]|uniref:Uncharacterized protein n=1 Tax=Caerostris darwini TaxID=1538125 RepID=A0AAV4VXN6_9ARAC|nr:hypothetical protein CDAR_188911 [Caerostris darwini]